MPGRTSERLVVGDTYSREQLRDQFAIKDATLNNGIFRMRDTDSVWLFITEHKTPDRTQYVDRLDGDDLYFEGQPQGRTDDLIEHHLRDGLEVLLFHRMRKNERDDYSFVFQGPFEFVGKESGPPTRFRMRRVAAPAAASASRLVLATSVEEVRENTRRFDRDQGEYPERRDSLISQSSYWVFDPERGVFAPSKFAAYRSMTFPRYQAAVNGSLSGAAFDGAVARDAIEAIAGDFQDNAVLRESLIQRTQARATVRLPESLSWKWRFASLPSPRRYWSLVCRPDTFDGLAAARDLPEIAWTCGREDVSVGDRVLIWQAKGNGDRRGVVAIGEVTRGVEIEEAPPAERPYWRSPEIGPTQRIRIRSIPSDRLPLWESPDVPWLSELAVARARGGTVFSLEPWQWHALATSTEAPPTPEPAPGRSGGRQGFGLSAAERKAVERHAQRIVEEYFIAAEYQVRDVSMNSPYDLHCSRADGELRVEVKGTTGDGDTVFLTRNEVDHARLHAGRVALAIVSGIRLERGGPLPLAAGGSMAIHNPWGIDEGELSPTQYDYRPSPESAKSIPIAGENGR